MLQKLLDLQNQGIDFVVITVASARGSIPSIPGEKLIVTAAGIKSGSIGGGKIEARAIEKAISLIADPSAPTCELVTWNLQKDIHMTCGGEMTLLFELLRSASAWHIAIFGAGHVVQALVPILATLPCMVDVIDTRREWLEKLPSTRNLNTHLVGVHIEKIDLISETTQVLSITQGHVTDFPILCEILRKLPTIRFLGVIGSASKRATLARELREAGIPRELIKKIHCPLGFPIGDNTPPQIAISITAQLLKEKPSPDLP